MSDQSTADLGGKQVVARAVAVLEALEGQTSGLSLGEIAKRAGLPKSTVQRLVGALEAQGFVVSGAAGVRLGPAITRLAASIHTDVVAIAAPFVDSASKRLRETVDLSVYRGAHALSVYQHSSDRELRVVSAVGAAFPIHATAHGKAMLGAMDDGQVGSLLDHALDACTEHTITDMPRLMEELTVIRSSGGVALDRQEHAEGVCGLGVVLVCGTDEMYAISVAVPSVRFERNLAEIKVALLKCKAEIEEQFSRR